MYHLQCQGEILHYPQSLGVVALSGGACCHNGNVYAMYTHTQVTYYDILQHYINNQVKLKKSRRSHWDPLQWFVGCVVPLFSSAFVVCENPRSNLASCVPHFEPSAWTVLNMESDSMHHRTCWNTRPCKDHLAIILMIDQYSNNTKSWISLLNIYI